MNAASGTPVIPLSNERIRHSVLGILAAAVLHAYTRESIANAVLGTMHSPRLGVTPIGTAYARVTDQSAKHGVKQVDRLVSNENFDLGKCFPAYVRHVLGQRRSIIVAMDWTEFALDGQSTICLYLITRHGRATPLVWKTVDTWTLKDRRNAFEDELLRLFADCLPLDRKMRVVILADRGFGDVALYTELEEDFGFDYVIRFRKNVFVEHEGERKRADEWLASAGSRSIHLREPRLTGRSKRVASFIAVHDARMKEPWFLATSLPGSLGAIVKLYGRRFTIEETFRDQKDMRFGMGLYHTTVTQPARRDRLLFFAALAQLLLTLIGAAGETLGLDAKLRVNTQTKRRTHSLFRQGREYLKGVAASVARELLDRFDSLFVAISTATCRYALV